MQGPTAPWVTGQSFTKTLLTICSVTQQFTLSRHSATATVGTVLGG